MANQTGNLSSTNGLAWVLTSPNDTLIVSPNPTGSFSIEYPLGSMAVVNASTSQTLAVSGGNAIVRCLSGAVSYSLADGPDPAQSDIGIPKDLWLDFVASGLTLPSAGLLSAAAMTAGVAYVSGLRVAVAGTLLALIASADNYVDLNKNGALTITAVALAAAAPPIAVNSIRLGFVKTGASTITSATQTGKDSLGNWMRNVNPKPTCIVAFASGGQTIGGASTTAINFASGEVYDNAAMHSNSVNNSRFTAPLPGLYRVVMGFNWNAAATGVGYVNLYKSTGGGASVAYPSIPPAVVVTGANSYLNSCTLQLLAGDYLEFVVIPNGNIFGNIGAYFEMVMQ